jgi:hypothetical protein
MPCFVRSFFSIYLPTCSFPSLRSKILLILASPRFFTGTIVACLFVVRIGSAQADLTLRLADYATAPKTGALRTPEDPVMVGNDWHLARLNYMAEEPGVDHDRFFIALRALKTFITTGSVLARQTKPS